MRVLFKFFRPNLKKNECIDEEDERGGKQSKEFGKAADANQFHSPITQARFPLTHGETLRAKIIK